MTGWLTAARLAGAWCGPSLRCLTIFVMALLAVTVRDAQAQMRPNIVLILTDDLNRKTMDIRPRVMPNTIALIAEAGVTFDNAITPVPVCGPARVSLLTGRYPHNHRVLRNNKEADGGFPAFYNNGGEQSTIATWLAATGYETGFVGKYLNSYPDGVENTYIPPGWTYWAAYDPGNLNGNYILNENGVRVAYNGATDSGYFTDVLARKSREFIDAAAGDGYPFFLVFSTNAPHGPALPASRHALLFNDRFAPRTLSFNEADLSDKPTFLQVPPMKGPEIGAIDSYFRNALRSLQAVDEALLGIYQRLEELGQLDRTYFVFTSDNGLHLGQHALAQGKETSYEEDIGIPLLISGPGIPRNRVVEHLVSLADLAPTIAEWAGVPWPAEQVDGRSLLPVLQDTPTTEWRNNLPIAIWDNFLGDAPSRTLQDFVGIRSVRFSYARYPKRPGQRSLYNMVRDPAQLENLAGSASQEFLDRLDLRTTLLATCAGSSCRTREDVAEPWQ